MFNIEKMTIDDVEPATRMRLQSWLDTYINEDEGGVTREWIEARNRVQLSPEKMAARKQRFSQSNTKGWVAKDRSGVIIGITTPHTDEHNVQHVGSLYVNKKWHGKGVGGKLMQKVIEWSDATRPIELEVVVHNERAKAFYRKWGFKETPNSEILFDNKIPVVKMVRKGDKE